MNHETKQKFVTTINFWRLDSLLQSLQFFFVFFFCDKTCLTYMYVLLLQVSERVCVCAYTLASCN